MTKGVGTHKNSKHKAIDINKKLLIIKSNDDIKKLIKKDNPSNDEITSLKAMLESSTQKEEKKKRNIVIPRFKICEDTNYKLKKFEKPTHYIRYELYRDQVTGIKLSDGCIIHYDLLKEDELFLESLNSYLNIHVNEEDFCKLIDKFEKLTGNSENKEEINFKDALKAAVDLKINYKTNIIKDIYTYWKAKRKKLGRPLLRMFWNNSQNILPHYSVFRSRVKEKMTLRKHKKKNSEIIVKMQELIDDFKRLDRILRKMKQRDEKKLLLLQLNSILFDQKKNEIKDKTYVCPMWNYFKDYKMEKIYKKFKKDKYYKSLYSNTNTNNNNSNNHYSNSINKYNYNYNSYNNGYSNSYNNSFNSSSFNVKSKLNSKYSDNSNPQITSKYNSNSTFNFNNNYTNFTSFTNFNSFTNFTNFTSCSNECIVNKKIMKKAKHSGSCEHLNRFKINPNEYKNVVLIKRRGRSNRIWIDRKYVDDINNEDLMCCDLSYAFNDLVDASLCLKRNYEEDMCNYIAGTQKHIPIKLNIKSGDLKNLDSNFFSNNKNMNKQNEEKDTDKDDNKNGEVLYEKCEEVKREKKRKRKEEHKKNSSHCQSNNLHSSTVQEEVDVPAKHSHAFADHSNYKSYYVIDSAKSTATVNNNNNSSHYNNNDSINNNRNGSNNDNASKNNNNKNSESNKYESSKYESSKYESNKYESNKYESNKYKGRMLSSASVNKTANECISGKTNGNCVLGDIVKDGTTIKTVNEDGLNMFEPNDKNESNSSLYNYSQQHYKTIFHFEDMINPLINKDNYIFCLSKYACVQKRILFYLENMLNFDNFRSRKKEVNRNSTQNELVNTLTAKVVKGKNNKESNCDELTIT
ncbi:hypothetical protein MKS88_005405 [Plasmodium brasilianum]|uniref:Enhancer of polycomb-like protein n=2 Tax=Plasmodium (Plasmodium) TaxID=418103 RepID=A0A1A8WBB8_PLAMA|nr:conserved Plasmodium protein, unknown function [Plasmodium malariae]KAI4834726.1 hypothetical protein MKS88_005405 [Plasmodium brasilianum]SBS90310.1 hypothetical protein PMALA_029350 [Plasmodium malariae]SCP03282.1 conserved Plasmodium protein, unknown function [Plasmodium malariae]